MSLPTVSTAGLMPGGSEVPETAVIRSWKAPIALAVFTALFGLLLVLAPRGGETVFRLSTEADAIQLPELVVSVSLTTWVCFAILAVLAGASAYFVRSWARTPLWIIIVFVVVLVLGFLTWAASGQTIPVVGLLAGTVALAVPLIYGALGGVIGERAGVVNIAIEGQLLAGAFSAAVVASITRQPLLGLVAAMVAGVLVAFVLAAFSIKYLVDQVIVGVVLNVLVIGLTSFLYSQVLQENAPLLNNPPRFDRIPIPLLSEIPVIGPVLFRQTIVVYLMYVAVALVYVGMFHTRWGLRLRAVGEHPQAADTVGIKVNATRFWNVLLAGAIAGIGGTVFTIGAAIPVQQGDDGRRRLHRARRGHLRSVGSDQGDACGAALRIRVECPEHPEHHRIAGAQRVPAHAAVPRDDLRRGRGGRQVPGPGRRRQTVHQGVTRVTDIDWDELRAIATDAMERAYAPYSRFKVGAAALVSDGRVVSGCNIENASYGVTLCAECSLVSDLFMSGGGKLVAFVCVDGEGRTLMPCGRCRQLLFEHAIPGMLLETVSGIRTIDEVLPDAFGPRELEEAAR